MEVKIKSYDGLTLRTRNKYVDDDISVLVDESLIPSGTLDITENGEHDVTSYEKVNVNIESSGGSGNDMMQARIDSVNNCNYLFSNYKGTDISFASSLDTSRCTAIEMMCVNCSNLITIPLWDFSNVVSMKQAFSSATGLITLPEFSTASVTNLNYTFMNCQNLTNIPKITSKKITSFLGSFDNCYYLSTIDIASMDNAKSTSSMCRRCYRLTKFIIREMSVVPPLSSDTFESCHRFVGTKINPSNPEGLKDGRIYIPDAMVEQVKAATNWSKYADIIVPLSTLEEE